MAQMQQNDNDNAVKKAEEEFLGGKLPVCYRETGSLLPRSYQFGTEKPKCSVVACGASFANII